MDIVSPQRRSKMMSGIRGKETKPEIVVRKAAHHMGYRFRLQRRNLPGSPDLVFVSRKIALFIHGCFWHRHEGCRLAYKPKSNVEFWQTKFKNNIARDMRVDKELKRLGWRVAIIWECETSDSDSLDMKLKKILG